MMKMNYKLKTCMALLLFLTAFLQMESATPPAMMMSDNGSLNGYVKDASSEETLIGASVSITGTKKGAYTNKSGYFSVQDIIPGKYKVRVTMIGYKPYEETFEFFKGKTVRKEFVLTPKNVITEEVKVTAEREVESKQITISKVNIPVAQIKEIRIGGESDVFRSLQMLPGILTSSQISSGLYIRGGSPDQNLILLDGSTVYNPTHLFGFFSTFNSDAIKDVELIKGGYPAEYGSRLSSVLNITQKDGNRNEFGGLVSLGLISSKASLEGPLGKGSWFIGGRRTYIDIVKKFMTEDPKSPFPDFGFYDLNGKITQDIGSNDKLYLSGFLSEDNFDMPTSGFKMNLFMGNKAGSLRWTHVFGDNFFTNINFSASEYHNGMNMDMSDYIMKVENEIEDYTLKGSSEWFMSELMTLNSGFEFTNYIFKYVRNFSGDSKSSQEGTNQGSRANLVFRDWLYNFYVQANHKFNDLITFQAGIRAAYWDNSHEFVVDPRLALRWQVQDNFAVKASWGLFHQYLRLAGDPNFSLFDTWLSTDNSVKPSQAYHYILSFETQPIEDIDLNFDLYYKQLDNISEVKKTAIKGDKVNDFFFSGKGKAYGGEIFLQKKIGNFAGWFGYALGWVEAQFDSLNGGKSFRPKYDRRHDLKLVLQYKLNDTWTIGGNFMFQTGQSYTAATSRSQFSLPGENAGTGKVFPSEMYGLRLPPSHQLNLNTTYNTTLFSLPFKLVLDIYNVYSRRDILMRFYNTTDETAKIEDIKLLPIIPTVSCELKF